MMFHVGQLVICVEKFKPDWRHRDAGVVIPQKGTIYTVRNLVSDLEGLGVLLSEIKNPPVQSRGGRLEPGFAIEGFRPLDESKLDVFRKIAANPPKRVDRRELVD